MAKQGGLGFKFLCGGYDVSGDVQALDQVSGGPALIDSTDITQSAHSRIFGLRDGHMAFTVFMDTANAHPVLDALPTADVLMTALVPDASAAQVIGGPAACLNAKQVGYDPTRTATGELTLKVAGDGSGYGLEWGEQLTAGVRTDTTATNGTAQDDGASFTTPSVPASGTPVTNTAPLPASVVVSGGTVSNVVVNGSSVGTGDGTYAVPAGQSITLTYSVAPTWTWTLQTTYGAQGYLQATAFTGTDVTVKVQHSADNSTWSDLITFTQVTAAPATDRQVVSNTTTVDRYVRAITTTSAGFTSASFAVVFCRNLVSGVTF